MKKYLIWISTIFLLITYTGLIGQTLQTFYAETGEYPYISAGFKLLDANGAELRNDGTITKIAADDVFVYEYDEYGVLVRRPLIKDPDCPAVTQTTFSAILVVDISTSMDDPVGEPGSSKRKDVVFQVLKEFVKKFDPKRTEIAITTFCGDAVGKGLLQNEPVRPFTTDKDSLNMAIDDMTLLCAGTNWNAAFLHANEKKWMKEFSALYYCQPTVARYKPVIIFLTDGAHLPNWGGPFDIFEVQKQATDRNATIYVVQVGTEELGQTNEDNLKQLALVGKGDDDNTDNYFFKIDNGNTLKDIYDRILQEAGSLGDPPPCYATWQTGCVATSATISMPKWGVEQTVNFAVNPEKKPNLDIAPRTLSFSNVSPATAKTNQIKLTAKKNYVILNSESQIFSVRGAGRYSVTNWGTYNGTPVTLPFELPEDSSITIELTYLPADSLFSKAIIELTGSACTGKEITASGEMLPFVENIDMGGVSVGSSSSKTFTQVFCNKTGKKIKVNSTRIDGTDKLDFSIISPKGSFDVDSGACVEMAFKFAPKAEPPRLESANITFETEYGGNKKFIGNISGNGLGGKTMTSVNPGFDSLSCKTETVESIILLQNTGNLQMDISNISIVPDETNFKIKGTVPTMIVASGEEPITVEFSGTLQNPDYTAILRVESNADNSPYDIPLSGPIRNVDFTISPATLAFGQVCVENPQTKQVTINNTGNVPITVSVTAGNFKLSPAEPYNIAVSGNQIVNVECAPTADGAFNADFSVTDADCILNKKIPLTATGVKPLIQIDKKMDMSATVGNEGEIIITLTNKSASPLKLTKLLPKDITRFTVKDVIPAITNDIPPGGTIKYTVVFKPKSGDGGIIRDSLVISGTTCGFDTVIVMSGNVGAATVHIALDDKSGLAGTPISYDLYQTDGIRFDESNTTMINTEISYDGDLLESDPITLETPGTGTTKIIKLTNLPVAPLNTYNSIKTLKFKIKNSLTKTTTPLTISNTVAVDGGANFIEDAGKFDLMTASAKLSIDTNLTGYIGEEISIPVYMKDTAGVGAHNKSITLIISLQPYILAPVNGIGSIDGVTGFLKVSYTNIPVKTNADDVLTYLKFMPVLGNFENTVITIDKASAEIGSINFTTKNGKYTHKGLCKNEENGVIRLFNPKGKAGILSINPNPSESKIQIEYEISEAAQTKMWVSDILGNPVYELINNIPETGIDEVSFDGTMLADGVYFIILQTPTQVFREKIYIVR